MDPRLSLQAATMLRLDGQGGILRESDPDGGPGPRLYAVGDAAGLQVWLRCGTDPAIIAAARVLAAGATGWTDPDRLPEAARELAELVDGEPQPSLIFTLDGVAAQTSALLSGSAEGEALVSNLARHGVPDHLAEAGFATVADLWPPWAAWLEDGQIAALAFAARLTTHGAEVGVYTFPAWRGRGLAQRVTAAWSRHPHLAGRQLYYSCAAGNAASRRVAAKLGLARIGCGLRVG